jgi:hypothetical protein
MSWHEALDEALEGAEAGSVRVAGPAGAEAEVDLRAVGPIGVRLGGLRLRHAEDRDLNTEAERLQELRGLPHRLIAQEVDPRLGGATLRSRPEELRRRDFFEVRIDGAREVGLRRYRVTDQGEREPAEFDLTREQLGDVLDGLCGEAQSS